MDQARQLAWTQWRKQFLETLRQDSRVTLGKEFVENPSKPELVEIKDRIRERWEHYERVIVLADVALKTAQQQNDTASWELAMKRCEEIMSVS